MLVSERVLFIYIYTHIVYFLFFLLGMIGMDLCWDRFTDLIGMILIVIGIGTFTEHLDRISQMFFSLGMILLG